jgi:ADP-dependent NAD(P)H-hydrate dehydratase
MSEPRVVTSAMLREWPLPRIGDDAGKRARGTVVVIGGAADTPGAVLLAGLAALRVGAGRLTIATVRSTAPALAVAMPEAAVSGLPGTDDGPIGAAAVADARDLVDGADVVVVGPGMRGPEESKAFVGGLLPHIADETTVVLDAMGLTCGAITSGRPVRRLVVTPNTQEALMLLDDDDEDGEREADAAMAAEVAERIGAVVALESNVASPDGQAWVDGSGNSGLGTSGSGDVLAGAIAGLAARGASPEQAAVWGAHVHAEAGERLAARVGRLGYLARELLDELPQVLGELDA